MSVRASAIPTPENLQAQYAGFFTRAIAFVIDILIINVSVIITSALLMLVFSFFESIMSITPGELGDWMSNVSVRAVNFSAVILLLVMAWLYPVIFWMINGQTVGKRIMGLRVVRMDGKKMTFLGGLLRVLGYWLSAIVFFVGFLWVLFSNDRRAWHDKLAGTCVIYSWDARGSVALREQMRNASQRLRNRPDEQPQSSL